jgi:hypothetical protein
MSLLSKAVIDIFLVTKVSQDELLSVFSAEEKTLFEKLSKLVESGKDVIAALDNVLGASGSVPVPMFVPLLSS